MSVKLFIIVSLFLSANVAAQTFDIPAIGAEWNEVTVDLESITYNKQAKRLEIRDDTIINSIRNSRLFTTWKSAFYQVGSPEN